VRQNGDGLTMFLRCFGLPGAPGADTMSLLLTAFSGSVSVRPTAGAASSICLAAASHPGLRKLYSSENNAPHHWEWTGPDGCIYDVFDFPFTDTDGSTLILEMGIDITKRKQAEDALKRLPFIPQPH